MPMTQYLKVGELAKATGKTVRAIHLYEQMGLIRSEGRTKGRYRLFNESSLERMNWISHLQAIGLSLTQIQNLIGTIGEAEIGREAHAHMRCLYEEKLGQVRGTIETLKGLERELDRSLEYLEYCKDCDRPKPKDACVDCTRERPLEKPALVRGLHAGVGWIESQAGRAESGNGIGDPEPSSPGAGRSVNRKPLSDQST